MTEDAAPGMATGSDAGAPGDHLPTAPLQPDEQLLLDEMRSDADDLPEASPEMVRAVEDDAPLPAPDSVAAKDSDDDPDDPSFSAS